MISEYTYFTLLIQKKGQNLIQQVEIVIVKRSEIPWFFALAIHIEIQNKQIRYLEPLALQTLLY